jgi:hypothetical protein
MTAKLQEGRKNAYLDKKFSYEEGIMSRREYLQLHKEKNCKVEEKLVRNYSKEQKESDYLEKLARRVPLGNPNYPETRKYLDRLEKLKKGFFEAEYRLYTSERTFLIISKTEYLYYLELN